MNRLLNIFVLSKSEQRVVLIVTLALIAGALVGYEWRIHARPVQATAAREPTTSPSPSTLDNEQ